MAKTRTRRGPQRGPGPVGPCLEKSLVTDSGSAHHEFDPSTAEGPSCRRPMHVKSVEAQMASHSCGVEVKERRCQLRCCPSHLTMVQSDEVRRQKPSSSGM
ncbi:hypothetical protein TNCV_4056761 [Trichonephila clavipes]|nr:hypothetical protein TNCV_4056761 [Trichonephila clavipes]